MSYKALIPEDVIQRMVFDWAETVRREQKEYLDALRSEGYCTAVCRSAEECESFITEYLRLGAFVAEVEG